MMNTPNCYLAQAGAEEANHKIDERTPSNQSRSSFGFVPFFKQNCISLYHPHEPIRALFEELLKEVVSQEKIALIVESLYKYCPKTLLSLAFVLPSFFSLDHPMIKRLEDMLQRYRLSANTFDQAAAYLALVMIEKTAQEEFPVDVEKFALPFANKDLFEEDVKIPSPFTYIPLALIAILVFKKTGDEKAKKVALSIASWQKSLLMTQGDMLIGPWMKEKDFSKANYYIWNYLLFSAVCGEYREKEALFRAIEKLPMELLEKIDPLTYFIAEAVEDCNNDENQLELDTLSSGKVFGLTVDGQEEGKWALSLFGDKTGFGSFGKNKIQIVSFGPHFFPLGEVDRFGIERGFNVLERSNESIQDHFTGWTLATYVSDEGRVWLNINLKKEAHGWKLQLKTEHLKKEQRFAFVFFVSAKSAQIGRQMKLYSSSLDRYVGQKETIHFSCGEEFLTIEPQFSTEQEVIPLAGMDHFWGADFLVAHTIKSCNQIYEWLIK